MWADNIKAAFSGIVSTTVNTINRVGGIFGYEYSPTQAQHMVDIAVAGVEGPMTALVEAVYPQLPPAIVQGGIHAMLHYLDGAAAGLIAGQTASQPKSPPVIQ